MTHINKIESSKNWLDFLKAGGHLSSSTIEEISNLLDKLQYLEIKLSDAHSLLYEVRDLLEDIDYDDTDLFNEIVDFLNE